MSAISVGNRFEASPTTAPGVPQNVAAEAGGKQISLTWDALPFRPRVRNYIIKRSLTTGDEVQIGISNHPSFVDTGLNNETEYFYTVSAVNKAGESADSSEVSATTWAIPDMPQNLTADGGAGEVALDWDDLSEPPGRTFVIKRGLTTGVEVEIATSDTNSYTDTGLEDATEYFYTVSARNGAGESADSNEASDTTDAP